MPALGFARSGADVALLARTVADLEDAAAEIRETGREVLVIPTDLRRSDQVRAAADRLRESWGTVDILVNNAGTNVRRSTPETRDEDWEEVIHTNVRSTFYCAREFLPLMKESGGRIINIGSVAGLVAIPTGLAYAASKGAVSHMTRSLAQEYAEFGINVNCVAPWYFRTPLTSGVLDDPEYMDRVLAETPLGRVGEDRDIIGVCVFLASAASAYVTGQIIALDGGMTASRFRNS